MKRERREFIIAIVVVISIFLLLGIAGNYDRQCEEEDAVIEQQLHQEYIMDSLHNTQYDEDTLH